VSTDDDEEISSSDRKHGVHNRPQRREPYRENKGSHGGDEKVQVKSKRVRRNGRGLSLTGLDCNRPRQGRRICPSDARRWEA